VKSSCPDAPGIVAGISEVSSAYGYTADGVLKDTVVRTPAEDVAVTLYSRSNTPLRTQTTLLLAKAGSSTASKLLALGTVLLPARNKYAPTAVTELQPPLNRVSRSASIPRTTGRKDFEAWL
jgi:hypothetical protein